MSEFAPPRWLARAELQSLLDLLLADGYTVLGPTVQSSAIVFDHVHRVEQLPTGWTHRQEAGKYRLERRNDNRCFGFTVGPHSWKQFLFPPQMNIATSTQDATGAWQCTTTPPTSERFAFLATRACDLAAIDVQDRIFLQPNYTDAVYASRRAATFIVAVNCGQSDPTCFCASMHSGPRCLSGFDLALTELDNGFTLEIGSERGEQLIARLAVRPATDDELDEADAQSRIAAQQQRTLDPTEARRVLLENLHHPQWDDIAARCLSCTNCTQVCPTCFCSSVREVADLDVSQVTRERVWDSCFNIDFSGMGGGFVRNSIKSRYRQWLTHKLATWHDQFDVSGCVGCGRCITWCPVGIDLTQEVAAFRGDS